MSKKILLIESDAGFAREVSDALEAAGFHVRTTSDGKEGFETAHEWSPEAIVLSAELPGTSGYLVCQRLKKDDAVKSIPLVLTSAEATADTFEKHRQLKVRAQDYLLKPYPPAELVEKLGALVGLPEAEGGASAEEVVSLDEEMGLEGLAAEPDALPALDLGSLPDEPAPAAAPPEDEDLKLLDDAFDLAAS
ncbi:MAG TPA: response regulator, partial [Anaeromyxobacter sp.]